MEMLCLINNLGIMFPLQVDGLLVLLDCRLYQWFNYSV